MSTETSPAAPKKITIALTAERPVRVDPREWPMLAQAKGDSWSGGNDYGRYSQAKARSELDEYVLSVRQHSDGRAVVYARVSGATAWTGTADRAEGRMMDSGADLPAAIIAVGGLCGVPDDVIRECVAELPPIDV